MVGAERAEPYAIARAQEAAEGGARSEAQASAAGRPAPKAARHHLWNLPYPQRQPVGEPKPAPRPAPVPQHPSEHARVTAQGAALEGQCE